MESSCASDSDFLRTRVRQPKLDGIRHRFLIWSWMFTICAVWSAEWIESAPRKRLGGYRRFKMNLYEICVLLPPSNERWLWKTDDETHPVKFVDEERQLPYLVPVFENSVVNTWQSELNCKPLSDHLMDNWWIMFPLKVYGTNLNQIAQVLLILSTVVLPMSLVISYLLRFTYLVGRFDDSVCIDVSFLCWDTATLCIGKRKEQLHTFQTPLFRCCNSFNSFWLSVIVVLTVGGAAFSSDFFFRPVRHSLTSHSYSVCRSFSQYCIWFAALFTFLALVGSFWRLVGIRGECFHTLNVSFAGLYHQAATIEKHSCHNSRGKHSVMFGDTNHSTIGPIQLPQ